MAEKQKSTSQEDNFNYRKFYEENGLDKAGEGNGDVEPEYKPWTPERLAWLAEAEARRKKKAEQKS